MKKSHIKRLRKYIVSHVRAQIDLALKGATYPEDHEAIEYNAKAAKQNLNAYIRGLDTIYPEPPTGPDFDTWFDSKYPMPSHYANQVTWRQRKKDARVIWDAARIGRSSNAR